MDAQIEQLLASMEEKHNQQQVQITHLLETIQQMPGIANPINVQVQPAPQDAAAVRADKVPRLTIGLRKSNRIKDFRHTKESNYGRILRNLMRKSNP